MHSLFFISLRFWTFRHHPSKTLHISSLIIALLNIFLKTCDLQGKVASASAGSRFHSLIVLFTKKYVLCFLPTILLPFSLCLLSDTLPSNVCSFHVSVTRWRNFVVSVRSSSVLPVCRSISDQSYWRTALITSNCAFTMHKAFSHPHNVQISFPNVCESELLCVLIRSCESVLINNNNSSFYEIQLIFV
jgi:hypothetical protein